MKFLQSPGYWKSFALISPLVLSASLAVGQGTSAQILMFHDTNFTDGVAAASSDVYPDNFCDMMEFLDRNYNVISLDQYVQWRKGNGTIPTNAMVVTFDDNYIGNFWYASPMMAQLEQPGTIFAHTAYVGAVTSKDHSDWDELTAIYNGGLMSIDSHTITHPKLTETSQLDAELQNSKSAITTNVSGAGCQYLAYPYGSYDTNVIARTQVAGYEAAVTTQPGFNTASTPLYELYRYGVGIEVSLEDFKSLIGYSGSDTGGPVIIDNSNSGFTTTGSWTTQGTAWTNYGHYNENFKQAVVVSSQTATAKFTPSLSYGSHDVYAWYASDPVDPYLNTAGATYRVRHAGGTTTKTVNQRVDKAGWKYLGRYTFYTGTSGYVELSNASSSGNFVCADAVKFQPVSSSAPVPSDSIIIDDVSSGFSSTGSWITSTSGYPYNGSGRVIKGSTGSPTATATWSATLPAEGYYEVGVWYTTSIATYRSDEAPFTVTSSDGFETILVNQQSDGPRDKRFNLLGVYPFEAGAQDIVSMSNAIGSASQYVSADAVSVRWIAPISAAVVPPVEVIVDNADAGFSTSSNWWASTSTYGYYGSNYHVRPTASTSDSAGWSVALPESGVYTVYARWSSGSNRAASAPFIVYHNGGSSVVRKNQQLNGGTWNALGTYNFSAGTSTKVRLSCWTTGGYYVVADAVKFVKQ
jgi:peptidoglycan/xylan/chitin deacetylase (PgdA/CDA1 family)